MTYKILNMQSDVNNSVYVYEKDGKKTPLNSLYSPEKEAIRFLSKLSNLNCNFHCGGVVRSLDSLHEVQGSISTINTLEGHGWVSEGRPGSL